MEVTSLAKAALCSSRANSHLFGKPIPLEPSVRKKLISRAQRDPAGAPAIGNDWGLPIAHLQLRTRARNRCRAIGCRTIADVVRGLDSGRLSIGTLGKKAWEEIVAGVATLREVTAKGRVDWEEFRARRGTIRGRVALTTPNLERICLETRGCGIRTLHLKKACAGLEAAGIQTIGALIDAARQGIMGVRNFGAVARAEVRAALPALSEAVLSDGSVDWTLYARKRGFPLLPEAETDEITGERALGLLGEICKKIIPGQMDGRAWRIFRRLLAPERQRKTLAAIGRGLGLSRERARQIETQAIEAIRKPLFEEDYFGLSFRFRPGLRKVFTDAKEHFDSLGRPAWRKSQWIGELARFWQVSPALIARYDLLLAELFGYRSVVAGLRHRSLEPLMLHASVSGTEAKRLGGLVGALHAILNAHRSELDFASLASALRKRRLGSRGLGEMSLLIELCSTAERLGEDRCRLKFEHLRNRPEQAFRVLSDHGVPMERMELLREINRRQLPKTQRLRSKRNLANQLSEDPRFRSVERTGLWTLKAWGKKAVNG